MKTQKQLVYTDWITLYAPKPWREQLFDEISSFADHYGLNRLSELCRHVKIFSKIVPENFPHPSTFVKDISEGLKLLRLPQEKKENSLENSLQGDVIFKVENTLIPAHKVSPWKFF